MKLLKLFLAFGCSLSMMAQGFTNYIEDDGLISNSVNCLAIDENDHVWIGTNNGLSFFDGLMWSSFTTDDGMVDNLITSLFVDSEGLLWVGTDYGLNSYDGANWNLYTEDDGLGDDRINHINQDSNGVIWVGENNGFTKLESGTLTSYSMADGLPFGGVNHISFDSNNEPWMANSIFGLIHFDGAEFTIYNTSSGLINNNVRTVEIDENDNKWVSTGSGISVLDSDNQVSTHHTIMLQLPPPDTLNPVVDMDFDSNGNIWVGIYVDYLVTVGGIAYGAEGNWYGYTDANGLAGPVVRDIAIDSQDYVWVATSTGVSKVAPQDVSIKETVVNRGLNIYPNPTSSELSISGIEKLKAIRLYNSMGVEVYCIQDELEGEVTINLAQFAKGYYIIEGLSQNGIFTERVVVK